MATRIGALVIHGLGFKEKGGFGLRADQAHHGIS